MLKYMNFFYSYILVFIRVDIPQEIWKRGTSYHKFMQILILSLIEDKHYQGHFTTITLAQRSAKVMDTKHNTLLDIVWNCYLNMEVYM